MRRCRHVILAGVGLLGACTPTVTLVPDLPIETGLGFVNLSKQHYVAFRVREHSDSANGTAPYFESHLLAPGAAQRVRMLDAVLTGCAGSLDVQVKVYRRVNDGVPIGLDPGEVIDSQPVASGEIFDLPACRVAELETYTFVNFDAPAGTARVKFAQDTPVDLAIREAGLFPNADAVWEVSGIVPDVSAAPPPHAPTVVMAGRALTLDGRGVEGVGVLIRPRFRVRLNDNDASNDPDAGFGEPIAATQTDAEGAFHFDRPAGAYQLEFFGDGLLFRPVTLEVESPSAEVSTFVEALP